MKISGKQLADTLLTDIRARVDRLKKNNINPAFAVLQVGDSVSSTSYIAQKKKTAKTVGISVKHVQFSRWVSYQKIAETIHRLNNNPAIYGIVIQQPLPPALSTGSFSDSVVLAKDIDGFRTKSPFKQPVARAVLKVLSTIYDSEQPARILKTKKVVIAGRGMTGGKPIADELSARKIPHIILHSKTTNKNEFYEIADVLITCIGKKHVIPTSKLKQDVVLIGVGISKYEGKYYGDYDEAKIQEKASHYTPTPGGIGPLTVAYLLENAVKAAEKTVKE